MRPPRVDRIRLPFSAVRPRARRDVHRAIGVRGGGPVLPPPPVAAAAAAAPPPSLGGRDPPVAACGRQLGLEACRGGGAFACWGGRRRHAAEGERQLAALLLLAERGAEARSRDEDDAVDDREQLERRVGFRRAMKRAVQNAMRLGASSNLSGIAISIDIGPALSGGKSGAAGS